MGIRPNEEKRRQLDRDVLQAMQPSTPVEYLTQRHIFAAMKRLGSLQTTHPEEVRLAIARLVNRGDIEAKLFDGTILYRLPREVSHASE